MNGDRAARTGLVSECYETVDEMMQASHKLADEMLAGSVLGVRVSTILDSIAELVMCSNLCYEQLFMLFLFFC